MEPISLIAGSVVRIALPVALLFWISARLRAWDLKGGVS
jgi:hypothetical protein